MVGRTLMPHQRRAVAWADGVRHPAFFLEMRLGKTLIAIDRVRRWGGGDILVVAPLSVLRSWQDELDAEGERWVRIEGGPERRRAVLGTAPWNLVSYESLRRSPWIAGVETDGRRIRPCPGSPSWDAVILDESTRVKNPRATITRICLRGFRGVPHRMILSGLPAPEGLEDYWPQMAFLRGRFMGRSSFWSWRSRHFTPDRMGWSWSPNRGVRDEILARVAEGAFVLTRREAGIGARKVRERRHVPMTAPQRRAFLRALQEFRDWDGRRTQWAMVRFLWMVRLSGGMTTDGSSVVSPAKFRELEGLILGDLRDERAVVWFHFNAELREALRRLRAAGVACEGMTGETAAAERAAVQDRFSAGETRVLLMQQAVGMYGLDLSAADTAVYYSHGFSLERRAQSEDRIIHPRKRAPLLFLDLITVGGTDAEVLDLLASKGIEARGLEWRVLGRLLGGPVPC